MGTKYDYKQALQKVKDQKKILVVGDESFYRDQIRNKIISVNSNLELVKFDAENNSEESIISALNYSDLFSNKRLIYIKNFLKIKKLEFLVNYKSENILILDSSSKGKSKVYKDLEENFFQVDCSKPKIWEQESDALSKIKGFFTSSGYEIENNVASHLFSNIGYDLYKLIREMQKLIIYKQNENKSKKISYEDINKVCVLNLNYNIFDIIEKIIEGKKQEALEILDTSYKFEKDPAILLITLWYTHFENLLYIKNVSEEKNVLDYVKLPPSIINKKLKPQANKLDNKKIIDSINYLTNLDMNLRKGSFDLKYYIDNFILNF